MQMFEDYMDEQVSEEVKKQVKRSERIQIAHKLGYSPEYVDKVMNRERKNADIHKALKFALQIKLTSGVQETEQA